MSSAPRRQGYALSAAVLFFGLGSQAQFPNATDVNGSLPAGSITKNATGSFTVLGGGADIWDVNDQFFFAYSEANGDFDVKVRVESLQPQNRWSRGWPSLRLRKAG